MFQKTCLFLILVPASVLSAGAQKPAAADYYKAIAKYDLSRLWRADSLFDQEEKKNFVFPEPLGFIGDNFQRFFIHYTSVRKNPQNPYEYIVAGKTRVKNTILPFTGKITVKRATLDRESDDPMYRQGTVYAEVRLFEDSVAAASGSFQGQLVTSCCIDKKGRIAYDAIMMVADGYSNNQCTAVWKSYRTGATKKCNWGDFRIPESGELDHGAGEFTVDEKYVRFGWESYVKSYSSDDEKERAAALAEEDRQWWKD
jgi:hypothetical protein